MKDGIIIGPESDQKDLKDFNKKIVHTDESGNIKNINENIDSSTTIHENDFITLKKINDYYYSERKNIDSFSFVLFATNIEDNRRIGLSYDFQPSINKSIIKAFSSSIRNPEAVDIRDLVIEEVKMQSGFIVSKSEIEYLGKCFVSSKMSEYCHLFGVAVDKTRQIKREVENNLKKDSGHYWSTVEEIKELEDWKAQIIVYKRYLNKKNQVLIKKKIE